MGKESRPAKIQKKNLFSPKENKEQREDPEIQVVGTRFILSPNLRS